MVERVLCFGTCS